jgi:Elongation factor G C-terminus
VYLPGNISFRTTGQHYVTTPAEPGDHPESVRFVAGDGARTSLPVLRRTLIPSARVARHYRRRRDDRSRLRSGCAERRTRPTAGCGTVRRRAVGPVERRPGGRPIGIVALRKAGTVVCEPMDHVELDIPKDAVNAVLTLLVRCAGTPDTPSPRADSATIEAVVPSAWLREVEQALPVLTGGTGVLLSKFDGYRPVNGLPPVRSRPGTDQVTDGDRPRRLWFASTRRVTWGPPTRRGAVVPRSAATPRPCAGWSPPSG